MTDSRDDPERTSPWLVRSEERARVAFPVRVRGRVRLTKRVVTEEVTQTFTLRREVLEVEELPGDEPGADPSWDSEIREADEPFDIVLHAEQLVPTTVVVPVERIRVVTRVVSTDVLVSADLLREQVRVEQEGRVPTTTATSAPAGGAHDDQTGADDGGARTTKEELT